MKHPDYIKKEYLEYLDELRESGDTDMFSARPYLLSKFKELSKKEATQVLTYWMETFGKRQREKEGIK